MLDKHSLITKEHLPLGNRPSGNADKLYRSAPRMGRKYLHIWFICLVFGMFFRHTQKETFAGHTKDGPWFQIRKLFAKHMFLSFWGTGGSCRNNLFGWNTDQLGGPETMCSIKFSLSTSWGCVQPLFERPASHEFGKWFIIYNQIICLYTPDM